MSDELREALKRSAAALAAADIPFALGGGYALWMHGAPEPTHDVDLVVAEPDVERAADALKRAGFRIERPPEAWLFKAHADAAMVDVLHAECGRPVSPDLLELAEIEQVLGVHMPVLPPTHVMTTKMLSMDERYCDFAALLPVARAIREQLDWDVIEHASEPNPFAFAFLVLLRRLGIAPER